jgi:hypothetical protein
MLGAVILMSVPALAQPDPGSMAAHGRVLYAQCCATRHAPVVSGCGYGTSVIGARAMGRTGPMRMCWMTNTSTDLSRYAAET